jgi:sugar/nucleoside kinase (ribokinase family)
MLLVLGDSNADATAGIERLPREGEDVPLHDLVWSSGGAGVNVATGFARLGGAARLVSRVGVDPAAKAALAAAEGAGVDLSAVERDAALATGVCVVLVSPSAERTFLSYRGANAAIEPPPPAAWERIAHAHVCGHALLGGRLTAAALAREAASRGVPISIDLCLPLLARPDVDPALHLFDVVFGNVAELAHLVGCDAAGPAGEESLIERVIAWKKACGARTVVVKRGARGATVLSDERTDAPPFEVRAVDTTAAGDGFVAAYLRARIAGASEGACARLAGAAGAITASRRGSADALPTLAEAARFLSERGAAGELSLVAAFATGSLAGARSP